MKGQTVNHPAHISRQELTASLRRLGVWSEQTNGAFDLAEQVHLKQRRAGGGPYLEEHVYPVTASVAEYLVDQESDLTGETVLIALLHDTVEDSDTVSIDTIGGRFGESVADGVRVLTKPEKRPGSASEITEDAEERYVSGIAAANWNVRAIKVLDRLNNLAAVHERPLERRRTYLEETQKHYLALAQSVDAKLAERMSTLIGEQEERFKQAFGKNPS